MVCWIKYETPLKRLYREIKNDCDRRGQAHDRLQVENKEHI